MNDNRNKTKLLAEKASIHEQIEKAKIEYEKIMIELVPFLPKTNSKEVTTEGAWQKTTNISCY